jgi:23S rRNA (cytosine1962-C5)-methyltransferase
LYQSLSEAWQARNSFHEAAVDCDVYRLLDGREEGIPGWTVDRYGDAVLGQCFAAGGADDAGVDALLSWFRELPDSSISLYLKEPRCGDDHRAQGRLIWGPPSSSIPDDPLPARPGRVEVREHGIRFAADLCHGHNTGIFADARPMRRWVREHSEGRRILNLFAYTCGFGIAASLGGARSAENVDLVASALERGRANYALNSLAAGSRSFMRSEVFEFLKKARKRGEQWDGVIVDPPPVPTRGRGRGFRPSRDQGRLITAVEACLAPGAWLLAMSAARSPAAFEEHLPAGEGVELRPDADFPQGVVPGLRARVLYPSG